jgi:hypothetical protein
VASRTARRRQEDPPMASSPQSESETAEFETDFWKDAQARKCWDDIVPGEPRRTLPYVLTLEAIQKYCRVVGDLHPLYFDADYAARSPYKGLIAPPSIDILLTFACTPADDWMRSPGRSMQAVLELQHSGAPGRHDPIAGAGAGQVHPA